MTDVVVLILPVMVVILTVVVVTIDLILSRLIRRHVTVLFVQ